MAALPPEPQASSDGDGMPELLAAVLCGGSSRRLGTDKASLVVGGVPLAVGVARTARAAGASRVIGIGARPEVAGLLAAEGGEVVADRWPGEGPAAGVVTAMLAAAAGPGDAPLLLVVGCDYPRLRPDTLVDLAAGLAADPGRAALVAESGGRLHPTVGVWRVAACVEAAVTYVADGGRSLTGLAETVGAVRRLVDGAELVDVDTPEDLAALDVATHRW